MDPATFNALLSTKGAFALRAATELAPTEANYLRCSDALRKRFDPDLARAALETVLLRKKAKSKFSKSDGMFFTREALEVASHELVSKYRAERFRGFNLVGDFACGIGADSLGLASLGITPVLVDRDEVRLKMAERNLKALFPNIPAQFNCLDLLKDLLPDVPAAFVDPARREGGTRHLALRDYAPAPAELLQRLPKDFPLVFKLAPGLAKRELDEFDAEAEFISLDGELKECALSFGPLKTARRRATVLNSNGEVHTLAADKRTYLAGPEELGQYLYDPDSAVVRADLVPVLAEQLGAWPVDSIVEMLSSNEWKPTPFASVYRIEASLPLDAKKLSAALRSHDLGRITVINRGSSVAPESLSSKWKLEGTRHRHLFLTQCRGKPAAILVEKLSPLS